MNKNGYTLTYLDSLDKALALLEEEKRRREAQCRKPTEKHPEGNFDRQYKLVYWFRPDAPDSFYHPDLTASRRTQLERKDKELRLPKELRPAPPPPPEYGTPPAPKPKAARKVTRAEPVPSPFGN